MDVEILRSLTKMRNEETGYRRIKLEDFTDVSQIPPFDSNIKWRKYTDRLPRRVTSNRTVTRTRPSMTTTGQSTEKTATEKTPTLNTVSSEKQIVRANSNTICSENKRKCRRAESSNEDEDMSGSGSGSDSGSDSRSQKFETPSARN